jgi:Tetratricopeptide repeat
MPGHWTRTRPADDYGIDSLIEVFELIGDGSGDAVPTGYDFGMQLKATDNETQRALSVGINWSTVNYWWLKPYGLEEKPEAQAWFKFDDRHKLTKHGTCWDDIVEEVRSFQAARERSVELPLELSLVGTRSNLSSAASLNAEIRDRLGGDDVLVDHTRSTPPTATADDHRVGVSLGGPIGVHFYGEQDEAPDAATVLLALAMCFGRMGRWREALRILRCCTDAQPLNDPQWLGLASSMSATAGDTELALDLVESFAERHEAHGSLASTLAGVLHATPDRSRFADRVCAISDRWVAAVSPGDERATMSFNMAMTCASVQNHDAATALFDRCVAESDRYVERDYYWVYSARTFLEVGEFDRSIEAYERAIDTGRYSRHTRQANRRGASP